MAGIERGRLAVLERCAGKDSEVRWQKTLAKHLILNALLLAKVLSCLYSCCISYSIQQISSAVSLCPKRLMRRTSILCRSISSPESAILPARSDPRRSTDCLWWPGCCTETPAHPSMRQDGTAL